MKEGAAETDAKAKSGRYQDYVQKHFARVRTENPAQGMAGWMMELGRGFRQERAQGLGPARGMNNESVSGGDAGAGMGGLVTTEEKAQGSTMDSVARKLDFLTLSG